MSEEAIDPLLDANHSNIQDVSPMSNRTALLLPLLTLFMVACAAPTTPLPAIASPAPTLTSLPFLATPYANSPAAGICGTADGQRVTINLEPGIANPRCVQVGADQMLTVVNATEETLDISLGDIRNSLAPGQSFDLNIPFGEYLARGVHRLGVSPCCGAELVLGIDLNS